VHSVHKDLDVLRLDSEVGKEGEEEVKRRWWNRTSECVGVGEEGKGFRRRRRAVEVVEGFVGEVEIRVGELGVPKGLEMGVVEDGEEEFESEVRVGSRIWGSSTRGDGIEGRSAGVEGWCDGILRRLADSIVEDELLEVGESRENGDESERRLSPRFVLELLVPVEGEFEGAVRKGEHREPW